jgi:hypothetical protein
MVSLLCLAISSEPVSPFNDYPYIYIKNDANHPITVKGYVKSFEDKNLDFAEWFWDPNAYQYKEEYLEYVEGLFNIPVDKKNVPFGWWTDLD